MTDRAELADLIDLTLNRTDPHSHVDDAGLWALTDAILAAGYRKPREIATVDELDALPQGTVIRAVEVRFKDREHGRIFERASVRSAWLELDPSDRMDGEETWLGEHLVHYFKGGITVLYAPEETADDH